MGKLENSQSPIQISAVIPTYNRGHLIHRAIESVLNQSYAPAEIIVVDDGSTDDTAAQVAAYKDRVRYLCQANSGSAAARHYGILTAASPWVALLDSDDSWHPDHLARVVTAIRTTAGQARFYFADTQRSSEEQGRRQWEIANFTVDGPHHLVPNAAAWVMQRRQPMMLQATVFSKAAYLECGGFWAPLRYRDDTHLYLKLGLGGAACAVNGLGCQMYDDDEGNRLSSNYNRAKQGSEMQVLMFRELLERGLPLSLAHERELKQRLSSAHRSMAKHYWRERRLGAALQQVMQSVVVLPDVLLSLPKKVAARLLKPQAVAREAL